MSDIKQLIRDIIDGKLSVEERNALIIALRESRKIQTMRNAAEFRVGTVVQPFGFSPKELNEIEGEIVGFSKQRKKVDLKIVKASAYSVRYPVGRTIHGMAVSNLREVSGKTAELDIDASADYDASALAAFLSS